MTMLLDNKTQGKVGETLAAGIGQDARPAILSSLFSIYGYRSLKKELSKIQSLRLLLPALNSSPDTAAGDSFRVPGLSGGEQDRQFRNALNVSQVARECAEWLEQNTEIKTVISPVPQNLFHVQNPDGKALAIHGSSSFTSSGLGFTPSPAYEMNTCFTTAEETNSLLTWFESIWDNAEATRDVKAEVLSQLREVYGNKSPDLLYFYTLYNLFRNVLGEIEEDKIIKTHTGIKDTLVWHKLYRFQRDGVLGAIDKVEKYNGCIIADSVGLGKTFEALAIIKYYELRNDRVLVLCPKKLRENWTVYTIIVADEFHTTQRFDLTAPAIVEQAFLASLTLADLPHTHFFALYSALVDRVIALDCARLTGQYSLESSSKKRDDRRQRLTACHELEGQIGELKAAIKKEPPFNRQVELNTHIKQLEQRLRQEASRL